MVTVNETPAVIEAEEQANGALLARQPAELAFVVCGSLHNPSRNGVCLRDRTKEGFLVFREGCGVELEMMLVAEPGQIISCVSPALRTSLQMVKLRAPRALTDAALTAAQMQPAQSLAV